VVPVKRLTEAKLRLAPVLNTTQRRSLMLHLLKHTFNLLQLLLQQNAIVGFLVVSRDTTVLKLTQTYKGTALLEEVADKPPHERLNIALAQAARWCSEEADASALLLLPSDLPLLEIEDLRALLGFLQLYPAQPLGVIAPDRHQKGTNALLVSPPNLLDFNYHFGLESFAAHFTALCHETARQTFICERPGLAFDLDLPEDLALLSATVRTALLEITPDCGS